MLSKASAPSFSGDSWFDDMPNFKPNEKQKAQFQKEQKKLASEQKKIDNIQRNVPKKPIRMQNDERKMKNNKREKPEFIPDDDPNEDPLQRWKRECAERRNRLLSEKPQTDRELAPQRKREEEFEECGRNMMNDVINFQNRLTSPPDSPRQQDMATTKARPASLMESGILDCRFRDVCNEFNYKNSERKPIWDFFDMDAISTDYNPPFDRNDLALKNSDEAERLMKLFKTTLRKGAGSVLDLFLHVVHIEHTNYAGKTTGYVTFCTKSDRDMFLENVMDGKIICNDMMTNFIQSKKAEEGASWKWRFSITTVDEKSALCEENMVSFLGFLTEQIHERQTRYPNGLNPRDVTTGRHLLIREAGSVDVYRAIVSFRAVEQRYNELMEDKNTSDSIANAMRGCLILHSKLFTGIDDEKFCEAIADRLNIIQKKFAVAKSVHEKVLHFWSELESASFNLRKQLRELHAFEEFSDNPISQKLATLLTRFPQVTPSTKLNELRTNFDTLLKRSHLIFSQTRECYTDDVNMCKIFQALKTLEIWIPTSLPSVLKEDHFRADVEWPTLPPSMSDLSASMIDTKYRLLARRYHPDRNQDSNATNMMGKLNAAKELLMAN